MKTFIQLFGPSWIRDDKLPMFGVLGSSARSYDDGKHETQNRLSSSLNMEIPGSWAGTTQQPP